MSADNGDMFDIFGYELLVALAEFNCMKVGAIEFAEIPGCRFRLGCDPSSYDEFVTGQFVEVGIGLSSVADKHLPTNFISQNLHYLCVELASS